MTEHRSWEAPAFSGALGGGDDDVVLLLAEESTARQSCIDHLERKEDWSDVLVVTFDGRLDAWVEGARGVQRARGVQPGADGDRPVTIVSVGDQSRSTAGVETSVTVPEADGGIRVETIPDPSATATLVDVIADGWDGRRPGDDQAALWFHSIESALAKLGDERGLKIVEAIARQCRARDARGYFHLDPSEADSETLRSLYALFDEVVQLDEEADPPTWRSDGFLWYPVAEGNRDEGDGRPDSPPADEPVTTTNPEATEPADPQLRVLLLGEAGDTTALLAAFLEQEGNLVVEAETEPAAILRPERLADVDCVVSDLDLDGTTVETFLRRLRAIDGDLPVLWLAPDHSAVPESLDADADRPNGDSEGPDPDHVFARDKSGLRALADHIPRAVERTAARPYRQAVEHAPDPIVLLDPDGTVEQYGGTIDTLLPELDDSDLPNGFGDLFLDGDEIGEGIAVAADGEYWTEELDLQIGNNEEAIPVTVSLNPVVTGGTISRIVASIVDVSEYREREADLEAERNRIEQAVKLLAHDLRNLLFVIDGNLETARESVETIESSFDRIEGRIRDAEALTSDAVLESVTAVDLGSTVEDTWEALETQDCQLVVADSATILADRNLLERLLENLFTNAVTHAGDDVTVRVGTKDEGFFVADDGVGIPPEDRERVFAEHFSTADSTGLGLSVVASVVDAHGWEIEVSESEAGGARFEITGVSFG